MTKCITVYCRSRDFRPSFSRLAELRALVPLGTPFMACTATATRSVKQEVIESLEMKGCEIVTASPDRPNIYYAVQPRTDVDIDFLPIVSTLRSETIRAARVLVYCQSLDMCSELYAHFHHELGDASYYPPGSSHISDYRVVFATIALGMGINLKDVDNIIHYGAPQSVEDYFQESGRGGRTGGNAMSTIYWKPADCPIRKQPVILRDHELIAVRRYVENVTVCRRKWLLDHFDVQLGTRASTSRCCDNCSKQPL